MKHIHTFTSFINESKQIITEKVITDFSNSKHKIIVGLKSNLIKDMKDRYEYVDVIKGEIYFFKGRKNNLVHFATLFNAGTQYQMLHHDGSLNDKGWIVEASLVKDKHVDHIEDIEIKSESDEETEEELQNYVDDKSDHCPRCGEHEDDCQCGEDDPWSTQNYHRVPKGEIKKSKPKQDFKK